MPVVPVVPIVFALAAVAVAFNQIRVDPVDSAAGLLIVLAGLPVYWWGIGRTAARLRTDAA
jgi:hypothetical protein